MPDLSLIQALDGMVGAPAFAPANDGHINRKEQNIITRTATIRSHFTVIIPYSVYKITIEKWKRTRKVAYTIRANRYQGYVLSIK